MENPFTKEDKIKIEQKLKFNKFLQIESYASNQGSFGLVAFAHNILNHEQYALKIQKLKDKEGKFNYKQLQFCKNEAETNQNLESQRVVKIYDHFRLENEYYVIQMQKVDYNLEEYLKKYEVDQKRFFKFAIDILQGIQTVHQRGYILRDLKPNNILVSKNGEIFLCDFGLAKSQLDDYFMTNIISQKSNSSMIKGNQIFLPPELILQVLENNEQKNSINKKFIKQNVQGDIWAFGMVLASMRKLDTFKYILQILSNKDFHHLIDQLLASQVEKDLIKFILKQDPNKRPTLQQIHSFIFQQLFQIDKTQDLMVISKQAFNEMQTKLNDQSQQLRLIKEEMLNQSFHSQLQLNSFQNLPNPIYINTSYESKQRDYISSYEQLDQQIGISKFDVNQNNLEIPHQQKYGHNQISNQLPQRVIQNNNQQKHYQLNQKHGITTGQKQVQRAFPTQYIKRDNQKSNKQFNNNQITVTTKINNSLTILDKSNQNKFVYNFEQIKDNKVSTSIGDKCNYQKNCPQKQILSMNYQQYYTSNLDQEKNQNIKIIESPLVYQNKLIKEPSYHPFDATLQNQYNYDQQPKTPSLTQLDITKMQNNDDSNNNLQNQSFIINKFEDQNQYQKNYHNISLSQSSLRSYPIEKNNHIKVKSQELFKKEEKVNISQNQNDKQNFFNNKIEPISNSYLPKKNQINSVSSFHDIPQTNQSNTKQINDNKDIYISDNYILQDQLKQNRQSEFKFNTTTLLFDFLLIICQLGLIKIFLHFYDSFDQRSSNKYLIFSILIVSLYFVVALYQGCCINVNLTYKQDVLKKQLIVNELLELVVFCQFLFLDCEEILIRSIFFLGYIINVFIKFLRDISFYKSVFEHKYKQRLYALLILPELYFQSSSQELKSMIFYRGFFIFFIYQIIFLNEMSIKKEEISVYFFFSFQISQFFIQSGEYYNQQFQFLEYLYIITLSFFFIQKLFKRNEDSILTFIESIFNYLSFWIVNQLPLFIKIIIFLLVVISLFYLSINKWNLIIIATILQVLVLYYAYHILKFNLIINFLTIFIIFKICLFCYYLIRK